MRVNATKLPEVDPNDDGYSSMNEVVLEEGSVRVGSIMSCGIQGVVWMSLLAVVCL
ncbi:hypothetical protein F4813DRAFT_350394 [Daldinia decipiens]|uniref:uncharacterized protein n=1 Tax=Daldinia decipiens TaxID=326647 RepID=UPI0020C498D3|nr:uncharacterized protein F4813DRAFT_350394 [Daldinia decipiens]KAI1660588.1 hypothetical protein F4813DRAFT_350394 [Daldinia decipiens]